MIHRKYRKMRIRVSSLQFQRGSNVRSRFAGRLCVGKRDLLEGKEFGRPVGQTAGRQNRYSGESARPWPKSSQCSETQVLHPVQKSDDRRMVAGWTSRGSAARAWLTLIACRSKGTVC